MPQDALLEQIPLDGQRVTLSVELQRELEVLLELLQEVTLDELEDPKAIGEQVENPL